MKKHWAARLSRGLCRQCGMEPIWRLKACLCLKCHAKHLAAGTKRRLLLKKKGLCTVCGKKPQDKNTKWYCASCYRSFLNRHKILYREYRRLVLNAYGKKCSCCREGTQEFLTVDHIYGKNHPIYQGISQLPNQLLRWIILNKYPRIFRILCYNCNCSIGHLGYCPHESDHET